MPVAMVKIQIVMMNKIMRVRKKMNWYDKYHYAILDKLDDLDKDEEIQMKDEEEDKKEDQSSEKVEETKA